MITSRIMEKKIDNFINRRFLSHTHPLTLHMGMFILFSYTHIPFTATETTFCNGKYWLNKRFIFRRITQYFYIVIPKNFYLNQFSAIRSELLGLIGHDRDDRARLTICNQVIDTDLVLMCDGKVIYFSVDVTVSLKIPEVVHVLNSSINIQIICEILNSSSIRTLVH